MTYVFLSFLLFAASIGAHVCFCRQTTQAGLRPKAFVVIAGCFLALYGTVIFVSPQPGFKITAGLIYVFLIPTYLSFYVLTQLTSPSKKILMSISRGGVFYKDILSHVEKEGFIISRLNDLVDSGCVVFENNMYTLSPQGQSIAMVLNGMQFLLGRQAGG